MIRINWYILLDLDIVDSLEDSKSVPDAHDGHFLQLFMS